MRRVAIAVLLVLTAIGGLASVFSVWAWRTVLDTDRFTALVMGVADEPEVTDAVATALVDQLLVIAEDRGVVADRVPPEVEPYLPLLVAAVRPAVEAEVSKILASDQAQDLLEGAVHRSHAAAMRVLRDDAPFSTGVISVSDQAVELDLISLVALGVDGLRELGILPESGVLEPLIGEMTPDELREAIEDSTGVVLDDDFGTVVVFDSPAIEEAGLMVRNARAGLVLFQRAVVAIVVITVALGGAALFLSDDRRRTGLALGLVVVGIGAVSLIVARRVTEAVPTLVTDPEARQAASTIAVGFSSGLIRLAEILVIVGAVVAVVGWLAGPGRVGRALRQRVDDEGGLPLALQTYADQSRLAGIGAAAVALVWLDWSGWTAVLALVLVLAGFAAPLLAARRVTPRLED